MTLDSVNSGNVLWLFQCKFFSLWPFLLFDVLGYLIRARAAGVSAALALLAAAPLQPAKALLILYFVETPDPMVYITPSGGVDLTDAVYIGSSSGCGYGPIGGAIVSASAVVCTGPNEIFLPTYQLLGPSSFNGTVNAFPASTTNGSPFAMSGELGYFSIDGDYVSGTELNTFATFQDTTLEQLGFTTSGLIGTWTLAGTSGTSGMIQIALVPYTPPAPVPGPLPLLGVGAAFGYSRRLRRRVSAGKARLPQG
jgi:hypothetical protein